MFYHLRHRRLLYNKIKEYGVEYFLLAITLCLQLYRLGIGEIQPWDEALYCVRANACLQYDSWLDQTSYSVGGLYSSTHPPLGVWGIALGKYLFGDATYAPRMFVAVCSILSLVYVYKIAKHLTTKRTALLSTILYGNVQIWLWYTHHAQLDVPMHTALLVSLYYVLKSRTLDFKSIIIAGVFLGIALLMKAFQGLYIVPMYCVLFLVFDRGNWLKKIFSVIGISIIISSPWYIMMDLQHSEYVSDWVGLLSSLVSGTYRSSPGHWWYYINQIIVNYPFLLLSPYIICAILKSNSYKTKYSPKDLMLFITTMYLFTLVVFVSLIKTNMPHFILFFSIPAIVCSVLCIENIIKNKISRPVIIFIILVFIGILWGGSEQLRLYVKGGMFLGFSYDIIKLVLFGVALFILIVYSFNKEKSLTPLVLLQVGISAIVFGNVYRWSMKDDAIFRDGAETISKSLENSSATNILLVHSDAAHEYLLPQFAYYSNGMNLGWNNKRRTTSVTYDELYQISNKSPLLTHDAVLVYKGWDRYHIPVRAASEAMRIIDSILITHNYSKVTTRQYLLYLR